MGRRILGNYPSVGEIGTTQYCKEVAIKGRGMFVKELLIHWNEQDPKYRPENTESICGKVAVLRNQPLAEFQLSFLHIY